MSDGKPPHFSPEPCCCAITCHRRHTWRLKAESMSADRPFALRRQLSYAARTPLPTPADSDDEEEKPAANGAPDETLFKLVPMGLL